MTAFSFEHPFEFSEKACILLFSLMYKLRISEDNIKRGFKETEWQVIDWIVLAQDRKISDFIKLGDLWNNEKLSSQKGGTYI